MKLLIITQKVDVKDPILGFFCRWIEEFGKHCSHVTVIGQKVADHNLSGNISVESMGKESGVSKASQIMHFWRILSSKRDEYDVVLVHMTPIWVVLGALHWKLYRKPVFLWYEARGTRWPLRFALRIVKQIFSASKRGMPLTTKKSVIVGHGIDVSLFKPSDQDPEPNRIVSVGRLTKAKRIELLLGLLRVLPETQLTLVGVPITGEDKKYVDSLKIAIHNENLEDRVTMGPLSQEELVHVLQRSSVFVHVSETALDKALLEAMACGIPVVSTSKAAPGTVPEECLATDVTLGDTIHSMLELSDSEREKLGKKLRSVIEEEHSLGSLIERLLNLMA